MDIRFIAEEAWRMMGDSGQNAIDAVWALDPQLAGLPMYGRPVAAAAAANDPVFASFQRDGIIGPHFRLPGEWLPRAASVVSLFFPYSEMVIESNRLDPAWPSAAWLHARIEGQTMLDRVMRSLAELLVKSGYLALVPSLGEDFVSSSPSVPSGSGKDYSSNWSERHVAYACGLGTFGVHAGLITGQGGAGRLSSLVTTLVVEPSGREYSRFDQWCTGCGACRKRCPVSALDGPVKDKHACSQYLGEIRVRYAPRYGCGKCYVGVPCERRRPGRAAAPSSMS